MSAEEAAGLSLLPLLFKTLMGRQNHSSAAEGLNSSKSKRKRKRRQREHGGEQSSPQAFSLEIRFRARLPTEAESNSFAIVVLPSNLQNFLTSASFILLFWVLVLLCSVLWSQGYQHQHQIHRKRSCFTLASPGRYPRSLPQQGTISRRAAGRQQGSKARKQWAKSSGVLCKFFVCLFLLYGAF